MRHRARPTRGYRSRFEHKHSAALLAAGFVYEKLRLQFQPQLRTYTPDWHRGYLVLEFKGVLTSADRTKMLAVKVQHPRLDIRFVFQNAYNRLNKTSHTTYADWATKHGFLWAHQRVPIFWMHEERLA